jgi:hypothetical protein
MALIPLKVRAGIAALTFAAAGPPLWERTQRNARWASSGRLCRAEVSVMKPLYCALMPARAFLVASALLVASAAQATTLTFNSTADCSSAGVSITSGTAAGPCILDTTPNGTLGLVHSGDGPLEAFWTATFTPLVTGLSVDLGDFGADPDHLVLSAFNSSHVLIGSTFFDIPATFSGMVTLSLPAVTDIASAVFGTTGGIGGIYADNLTFSAVPGPIAGAGLPGLILAGGGLLVLARRRRQRTA